MSKPKQQLLLGFDFGDAAIEEAPVEEAQVKKPTAKKKAAKAEPKKKSRKLFRFSLDAEKEDENQMIADLEHFKSERQYASTIRKALALFFALLLGDVSVLQELFPNIVKLIQDKATLKLLVENAKLEKHTARLEVEIEKTEEYIVALEVEKERQRAEAAAIQARFDRLEGILSTHGYRHERQVELKVVPHADTVGLKGRQNNTNPNSGSVGLKGADIGAQMSAPPPPTFDDDDMPTLDFSASKSKTNANQNLINSMLGLQD